MRCGSENNHNNHYHVRQYDHNEQKAEDGPEVALPVFVLGETRQPEPTDGASIYNRYRAQRDPCSRS